MDWSAPKYRKEMNQPLNFAECLKVLETCVECGMISPDPNPNDEPKRKKHIMVYHSAGSDGFPEGWYSQHISDVAQELLADIEGQRVLRKALQDKNVDLVFREWFPPKEGEAVGRHYLDER